MSGYFLAIARNPGQHAAENTAAVFCSTAADHSCRSPAVPDGESPPQSKLRRPCTPPPSLRSPFFQAAAAASRPASVSSLATALAILVAFTASAGAAAAAGGTGGQGSVPVGGHAAVAEEAFSCLVSLSETAVESSAQAECVKVALVSLKECAQVGGVGGSGEARKEKEEEILLGQPSEVNFWSQS